jgi:pyridoxamine 5'-phosphate oxidase
LLKSLVAEAGHLVFYTNYDSRKAVELESGGVAAGVLYWPTPGRQLRFEGQVERSPGPESDAYFAARPRLSQLNAWASAQSLPLDSPDAMAVQLAKQAERFEAEAAIPRPPNWGGYRLAIEAVEFWVEGADRFHERLRYERARDGWTSAWLQP